MLTMALLALGCESTETTNSTQPATPTGSATSAPAANSQLTPAEQRVNALQALDREYGQGGMPTNVYYMRQQEILGMY